MTIQDISHQLDTEHLEWTIHACWGNKCRILPEADAGCQRRVVVEHLQFLPLLAHVHPVANTSTVMESWEISQKSFCINNLPNIFQEKWNSQTPGLPACSTSPGSEGNKTKPPSYNWCTMPTSFLEETGVVTRPLTENERERQIRECPKSDKCFSNYYVQKQLLLSARLSHYNSVCLSHGWISQKRCKIESPNLHCRLPERL